jgi:SAM-dependent methyltransferase
MPLTDETFDPLRCQQTLQPLELRETGFYSQAADLLYPIREGLVFMGYDKRDAAFVRRVIEEERLHQTSPEHLERDLAFLRESAGAVVDLINVLTANGFLRPGMRGVEVGSASGWPSWLFAEAGSDMWLCELEPNSLASGLSFRHPNIGDHQRIVCDATLLPFADSTFDFVLCKEFAHHFPDKTKVLREANRVLRNDGLLILFEPVRSLLSTLLELRSPDPHFGHAISWPRGYFNALKGSGFRSGSYANYHVGAGGRFSLVRRLRQRSRERLRRGKLSLDPLSRSFMWLAGGSVLVLGRKSERTGLRPSVSIAVIQPEQETWTRGASYDRSALMAELRSAAKRLEAPVSTAS